MTTDVEKEGPISSMRLRRVSEVCKTPGYEPFSPSVLRHLIFDSRDRTGSGGTIIPGNGLGPAIIRIGRRIMLDLNAFDRWLEAQREGG